MSEAIKQRALKYWNGQAGVNRLFPKGQDMPDIDSPMWVRKFCTGLTCEVGCGAGRIAQFFEPADYIGVDINPTAIAQAVERSPEYDFRTIEWGEQYPPEAESFLFYTVLLHVHDDLLEDVIARTGDKRVVVFESMSDKLGNGVHNFQRCPETYSQIFASCGKQTLHHEHLTSTAPPYFRDYMVFQ